MQESLPTTERQTAPGRWAVPLAWALIAAAMVVAAYLLWLSAGGLAIAGCGPASACQEVLNSRWSAWLGLPVSLLALACYGVFLAGTWLVVWPAAGWSRKAGAAAVVVTGVMIVGAAGWFVATQLVAIKTICPFCMTAHLLGTAGVALLWTPAARRRWLRQDSPVAGGRVLATASLVALLVVGLLGVAALIAGQLLSAPKTYVARKAARQPGELVERLPGGGLSLYGGRFQLEPAQLPVIGSADAPSLVLYFFTYTCPHCRALHGRLKAAQQAAGGRLGIVCLPVPLERECNRLVEMTRREHVNSCEFGRQALALARLGQAQFRQLDDWLFQGEKPPSLAQARARANELAGPDALALANPALTAQIRTNVDIYAENSARLGSSELPQLILGDTLVAGEINDTDELVRLLNKHLGLKLPRK